MKTLLTYADVSKEYSAKFQKSFIGKSKEQMLKELNGKIKPNKLIKLDKIGFTDLEQKVIAILKSSDEFDEKPCNCFENMVNVKVGLSAKVLRGVISSLIQKNIITEGEYPNGMKAYYYNPQ